MASLVAIGTVMRGGRRCESATPILSFGLQRCPSIDAEGEVCLAARTSRKLATTVRIVTPFAGVASQRGEHCETQARITRHPTSDCPGWRISLGTYADYEDFLCGLPKLQRAFGKRPQAEGLLPWPSPRGRMTVLIANPSKGQEARNEDLLTERSTLAIPRLCHNA